MASRALVAATTLLIGSCTAQPTVSPSDNAIPTVQPVAPASALTVTPGPTASPDSTATPEIAPPTSEATTSPGPSAAVVAHRIGVRVTSGGGEFYDRQTDASFVPRGFNYIRLVDGRHATLDSGVYDTARVEADFAAMEQLGYNTVRIFFDMYRMGTPTGGLDPAYVDNVVDVLSVAGRHNLFVLFAAADGLPLPQGYEFDGGPNFEVENGLYLSVPGVAASERYFGDLARALVERRARLDRLLGYELNNELFFLESYPPFSLGGSVTTANGLSYDMSSSDDRQRMLEDNLVYWIDNMRAAIQAVDPSALVTVGFFQPKGPIPSREGDTRIIETRRAILESTADFIDLHGYPGGDLDLAQLATNFKLPPTTDKPILLGEFGAEHSAYPAVDDAERALVAWQINSCTHGFDGWLLWMWDSAEMPEYWSGVDNDARIAHALAPTTRPDPCSMGALDLATNLSDGAQASASSTAPGYPPPNAIDGLPGTYWNSSGGVPQWIRIDLGATHTVDEIRMLVAQSPAGKSRHVVSVKGPTGTWREVHVFEGVTSDSDLLVFAPDGGLQNVRFVRIETTQIVADLWPAWRDVTVLGR